MRVVLCVPRKNPSHGNIIYADTVFDAAQVRVDLARSVLRELGINAVGEVGDPDPYTATMDMVAEYQPGPHHRVHPARRRPRGGCAATSSSASRTPSTYRSSTSSPTSTTRPSPFDTTLVVANRTTNSDALIAELRREADAEPEGRARLFIFVVPLEGGEGVAAEARPGAHWTRSSTAPAQPTCSPPA